MGEPAKKSWTWGKIALLVSLALNLVVAGALVGASFGGGFGKHGADFRGVRPPGLRAYVQALPNDLRQQYFQQTRGYGKQLRKLVRNSAARNEAAVKVLQTDPFSQQDFLAALDKQGQNFIAVLEQYHGQLVKVIEAMTPEQRRQYAQKVKNFKSQHRNRRQRN